MRMFGAGVNVQLEEHIAGELVLGEHSLDRRFDDIFGFACAKIRKLNVFFAADVAAVEHIFLAVFLFAGHADFFRVDYNYVVAAVGIGRVNRLMASAEYVGDFYGQTTQHLVGRIDHIPLLLLVFLCYCRIHLCKEKYGTLGFAPT